jgi:hypothetical protein
MRTQHGILCRRTLAVTAAVGNWYRIAAWPCGPYEAGTVGATNQMGLEGAKIAHYLGR